MSDVRQSPARARDDRGRAGGALGDLRLVALCELLTMSPTGFADRDCRRMALAALNSSSDTLYRHGHLGHLTASVFIVRPDGAVLLTHHAKYGRWQQLGGHLEPADPSIAGAALREAREESGLVGLRLVEPVVQLTALPVPCPQPGSWHFDVRYLVLSDRADFTVSDESNDLGWFGVGDLPSDEQHVLDGAARAVALAAKLGHCPAN